MSLFLTITAYSFVINKFFFFLRIHTTKQKKIFNYVETFNDEKLTEIEESWKSYTYKKTYKLDQCLKQVCY